VWHRLSGLVRRRLYSRLIYSKSKYSTRLTSSISGFTLGGRPINKKSNSNNSSKLTKVYTLISL
jgi:hypothetical protein